MTSKPGKDFEKNLDLEALSAQINTFIGGYELHPGSTDQLKWPPLFIVGAPRSGTTLLLQYLASTGAFAYPTNLMSRFHASLPFACQVQLMLADKRFDFRGEFSDVHTAVKFESILGKTRGIAQPNEFWYFWRRFFPLEVPARLDDAQLESVDSGRFVSELSAMESLFARPLLMKAVLLCFHIEYLHRLLNNAIFLYIKRDTISNARSLLKAREAYSGTHEKWYSTKPPGCEQLMNRSAFEQVVGQVLLTNREIERQLDSLPEKSVIRVEYERFCDSPTSLLDEVNRKFKSSGVDIVFDEENLSSSAIHKNRESTQWKPELSDAYRSLKSLKI